MFPCDSVPLIIYFPGILYCEEDVTTLTTVNMVNITACRRPKVIIFHTSGKFVSSLKDIGWEIPEIVEVLGSKSRLAERERRQVNSYFCLSGAPLVVTFPVAKLFQPLAPGWAIHVSVCPTKVMPGKRIELNRGSAVLPAAVKGRHESPTSQWLRASTASYHHPSQVQQPLHSTVKLFYTEAVR